MRQSAVRLLCPEPNIFATAGVPYYWPTGAVARILHLVTCQGVETEARSSQTVAGTGPFRDTPSDRFHQVASCSSGDFDLHPIDLCPRLLLPSIVTGPRFGKFGLDDS